MAVDSRAEKAVEKIMYELMMVRNTAKKLIANQSSNVMSTALLESFLLHVRVLYNFFTLKKHNDKYLTNTNEPMEILAIHFFNNPSRWKNKISRLFKYCRNNLSSNKGQLTDINKYLTHLTYPRIDKKLNWDIKAILNDIEDSWNIFLDTLEERENKWFKGFITNTLSVLPISIESSLKIFRTSQGFSSIDHDAKNEGW